MYVVSCYHVYRLYSVDAKMPVIFSDKITRLAPDTFWLGAGEVDLKIGMSAAHFVDAAKPYVADITY